MAVRGDDLLSGDADFSEPEKEKSAVLI